MKEKIIKRRPIGNPTRKWRQENFIISTFSGVGRETEKGLTLLKDAGFNLIEMAWVNIDYVDQSIPAAEKVGIDLLYQDWRYFGGFQDLIRHDIDEEKIKEMIAWCKKSDRILGYYVWDEPYMPADIEVTAIQTDIMERLDENRLPFSVAIPSYNGSYQYGNDLYDDYFDRYVKQVNPPVLSVDYYPFHTFKPNDEDQLDGCPVYKDLFLLRKHGLETNTPIWYYYQGMDYFEFAYISPEKQAMGAYLSLLYGVKGIQHYTALGTMIDDDGNKLSAYEDVKRLNQRFIAWGNTLMALTSTGIFHDDAVLASDPKKANYTEDFSASALFEGRLPARISVGEFKDGEGNPYVLILNRDYINHRSFSLPLKKAMHVYETSKEDGKQGLASENVCVLTGDLAPSECVLLRLQPAEETPYLIEYKLEK